MRVRMQFPARVLALTVSFLMALTGCPGGRATTREAPTVEQELPVTVGAESIATVSREKIERGPTLTGVLEPALTAQIRSEIAGPVIRVNAEASDLIRRGQLLVRIEDRSQREAVNAATSMSDAAEIDWVVSGRQAGRMARLFRAGAVSRRDAEVARDAAASSSARLDQARAQLALAERQLTAARIRAPFTALVSERFVGPGDVVTPGSPLYTIFDPTSVRLRATVSSAAASVLAVGTPAQFTVTGYPDRRFEGIVTRIVPEASPTTRQITILVRLADPDPRLIAGLFAEGRVAVESKEALVLPLSALDESSSHVLRIVTHEEGTTWLEDAPVETGLIDDRTERVEIEQGLNEGDRVLVGAARTLPPGSRVLIATE